MLCDTLKGWGLQGKPSVEQGMRRSSGAWAAGNLSPESRTHAPGCSHLSAACMVMGGRRALVGSSSSSC